MDEGGARRCLHMYTFLTCSFRSFFFLSFDAANDVCDLRYLSPFPFRSMPVKGNGKYSCSCCNCSTSSSGSSVINAETQWIPHFWRTVYSAYKCRQMDRPIGARQTTKPTNGARSKRRLFRNSRCYWWQGFGGTAFAALWRSESKQCFWMDRWVEDNESKASVATLLIETHK